MRLCKAVIHKQNGNRCRQTPPLAALATFRCSVSKSCSTHIYLISFFQPGGKKWPLSCPERRRWVNRIVLKSQHSAPRSGRRGPLWFIALAARKQVQFSSQLRNNHSLRCPLCDRKLLVAQVSAAKMMLINLRGGQVTTLNLISISLLLSAALHTPSTSPNHIRGWVSNRPPDLLLLNYYPASKSEWPEQVIRLDLIERET